MVRAPQRMYPVWAQWHICGGIRGRPAQRRLQGNGSALDHRLIAHLHIPARGAGVAAHRPAVLLCRGVVLQHGVKDIGGQVAIFGFGRLFQAGQIVLGNFDGGLGHQLIRRGFNGIDRDHGVLPVIPPRPAYRVHPREGSFPRGVQC